MAHTISVSDEVYAKLVEKARRLDLPIGRVVAVDEEKEKERTPESKERKEDFVSRQDFNLLKENFERLVEHYNNFIAEAQDRLKEVEGKLMNVKFCPNCGHILYSHFQDHSSHKLKHYEYVDDSVLGRDPYYHLECPRCGFYVELEKPKFWHYKDPERQVWDLRNAEGKGESEEDEEVKAGED